MAQSFSSYFRSSNLQSKSKYIEDGTISVALPLDTSKISLSGDTFVQLRETLTVAIGGVVTVIIP